MRLIPKHYSDLRMSDYFIYLSSLFGSREKSLTVEKVWQKRFPNKRLFGTPTGRHALWYFFEATNLPKGSEVLVAAYNLYVIPRMIIQKGLTPVFVDIERVTLCMDVHDLAKKITSKTKAVVVTHMFGNPANITEIKKLCAKHKLLLFEDSAHAMGTTVDTVQVGNFGDGALFSFGIYKLVNTFGGGLFVLSKRFKFTDPGDGTSGVASFMDNFMRFLFSLGFHPAFYGLVLGPLMTYSKRKLPKLYHLVHPSGDNPKYRFSPSSRAPYKPFMTEMAKMQTKRISTNVLARRRVAAEIKKGLATVKGVTLLKEDKYGRANYSYFGIYVSDPLKVSRHLLDQKIDNDPKEYYDCSSLNQFRKFKSINKNANWAENHLLRLPSYPTLSKTDIDRVVSGVRSYFVSA